MGGSGTRFKQVNDVNITSLEGGMMKDRKDVASFFFY